MKLINIFCLHCSSLKLLINQFKLEMIKTTLSNESGVIKASKYNHTSWKVPQLIWT